MDKDKTREILLKVAEGKISVDDAMMNLKTAPFEDVGFARIDHHRKLRQGAAEVIYGAGKTYEQIEKIVSKMQDNGQETVIVTRIGCDDADRLAERFEIKYSCEGRIAVIGKIPEGTGKIAVVTGGTSDIPVAEEAAVTAEALGSRVIRIYDAGVAGIHRLFASLDDLMSARAVVAIAGMEGALASVVGGLVACPVIAVPTSVGYGASFGGLSALLSMLNSCASGVSVVNIDNGFGAGYIASMINRIGEEQGNK